MAIRFRTVTGNLVHPRAGYPLSGALLEFALTSGFGLTATHLITDAPVLVKTDDAGRFNIDLWCDEDGLRPIDYQVTLPKDSGGEPIHEPAYQGVFSLVYGDGTTIDLPGLLIGSVAPPSSTAPLYALIDARILARSGAVLNDFSLPSGIADYTDLTVELDQFQMEAALRTIVGRLKAGGASFSDFRVPSAIADYTDLTVELDQFQTQDAIRTLAKRLGATVI